MVFLLSILWQRMLDFNNFESTLVIVVFLEATKRAAERLTACLVHFYYFVKYVFDLRPLVLVLNYMSLA